MIVKQLFFEDDARKRLMSGIEKLAKAVGSTMGARGRTVLIESENHVGGLTISKDGVTVAKSINLEDPLENLAVQLVREAAEKTVAMAGDGTTTATVLTHSIVKNATEEIKDKKINVVEVCRQLQILKDVVIDELQDMSTKLDGKFLKDVATISANNDEPLGKLIAKTYEKVGRRGVVTVENSPNHETEATVIKGLRFDRGWASKYFVNDEKSQSCVFQKPLILVADMEINTLQSIEQVIKYCIENKRPLVIIGELSQQALQTLNLNVARGTIKACQVLPPSFGAKRELLTSDIAVAVGAKYFSESTGDNLQLISPITDLGTCDKIIISQDSTNIVVPQNEKAKELIKSLKERLQSTTSKHEIKNLKDRISNLSGSVGIIYVGADSDIEQKEKRDRVDDAVLAVAAAIEEGVLPGGGTALIRAFHKISNSFQHHSPTTEESKVAKDIMMKSISAPFIKILSNAGYSFNDIRVDEIIASDFGVGVDVRTGEYVDMMSMGIIDATKVTRVALTNAVSVATTILTTDTAITNIRA